MKKILLPFILILLLVSESFGQQFQNNAPCPVGNQNGPNPLNWAD